MILIALIFLCLAGCGRGEETAKTQKPGERLMRRSQREVAERHGAGENRPGPGQSYAREIPIDFPFYESDPYVLVMEVPADAAGEYVLKLYGEAGAVLQRIPCGRLAEPITFSYDGIFYGHWTDLEVFPDGSDTGLLFEWEEERFSREAVEVPRYAEVRNRAMLTVREDGKRQEKCIYQLNEFRKQAEEVRTWSLDRESGLLLIGDSLRRQSLFEGNVSLDEEGVPGNLEYYEYLFWEGRNLLWDYSDDPVVRAWVSEERTEGEDARGLESFEMVQNQVFGNPGHTAEYESRQAFLESCGYAGEEPVYQYFDRFQNLQLELYRDRENRKFYGIAYLRRVNCHRESVAELFGFTVCGLGDREWEEGGAFSLLSADGTTGEGLVGEYREKLEYTESGKPDYFLSQGLMEECGVDVLGNLLEINFLYREDGTLFCRDYHHDARTFGSTLCSLESLYDERERVVYETGYITHGFCEYYYIYEDEGQKPAYMLYLDYNGGYAIPRMVRYR